MSSKQVYKLVDRATFPSELDALRVREKAHTHAGEAIAAARRRLPMAEVDAFTPLITERGTVSLLDAFEGRIIPSRTEGAELRELTTILPELI